MAKVFAEAKPRQRFLRFGKPEPYKEDSDRFIEAKEPPPL